MLLLHIIYHTYLNGTRHSLYLPCNSQDSFPVDKTRRSAWIAPTDGIIPAKLLDTSLHRSHVDTET